MCTDGHHGRKSVRRFHSRQCVLRSLRICGRFLFAREALDSALAGVAVKASKRAREGDVTQLGCRWSDNIVLFIERGCLFFTRYRLWVSNVCGQEQTDQAAGDPSLTSPGRASISELRRKLSHDTSPSVPEKPLMWRPFPAWVASATGAWRQSGKARVRPGGQGILRLLDVSLPADGLWRETAVVDDNRTESTCQTVIFAATQEVFF